MLNIKKTTTIDYHFHYEMGGLKALIKWVFGVIV